MEPNDNANQDWCDFEQADKTVFESYSCTMEGNTFIVYDESITEPAKNMGKDNSIIESSDNMAHGSSVKEPTQNIVHGSSIIEPTQNIAHGSSIMESFDNTAYHSCIKEGSNFIVYDDDILKSTGNAVHDNCIIECSEDSVRDRCIMESTDVTTVYYVDIENELHITVGDAENVSLELVSGMAEICGAEVIPNKVYQFQPYSSVSLFSWKGCKVKLKGNVKNAEVSTDSQIMLLVGIHACLEEKRIVADSRNKNGPACLVVGPLQSGKSSFCRFLVNYATRMGRKPLFVNLDVAHNPWTLPGSINVIRVKKPFGFTEDFKEQASSIFNFGYLQPRENMPLYCFLVGKLGEILVKLMDGRSRRTRHSGMIIDTWRCEKGEGYKALTIAVSSFHVDVLFVLEDEKLYEQLVAEIPSTVQIVYVPKQKNVVEKSLVLLDDVQTKRVYQYFYGTVENRLQPYEFKIGFSEVEVYQIVSSTSDSGDQYTNVVKPVPIGPELVNQVLGLSFADAEHENDVMMLTNVKGYIFIVGVDMREKLATVLSPQPSPLTSRILIMGDMELVKIIE